MRITSQNEMIDVNYDSCTLCVDGKDGVWQIEAYPTGGSAYSVVLGNFPTKTAAVQELARVWNSLGRGCTNHQITKGDGV